MQLGDAYREDWQSTPEGLRRELQAQLEPGEEPLACFRTDLDARFNFSDGLIVLTNRRLLGLDCQPYAETAARDVPPDRAWRAWPLESIAELQILEKRGHSLLELRGHDALLTAWPFTAGRLSAAVRLVAAFNARQSGEAPSRLREVVGLCPSCGQALPAGQSKCPTCVPAETAPPVKSLWRLKRFARPRAKRIALGVLLTLASTIAGLVPPYLTMPLLDRVLVPFQEGKEAAFGLVPWYLGGMFLAAIVAWLLAWAKTYVLASVGEQISADLRNTTYAHMQRLSLEFFGSKRTGDLISRVSSDSDRVCNFLSVNLADFSTDALMIIMTVVALLSISPTMAVVTLLPFPFIAWMIQDMRIRLRRGFARGNFAWVEMVNVLADTIPGIRVVKAFAQEQREIDRFRRRNDHVLDANNRVNRLWAMFGPAITLSTDLGLLVIWGYGAWSVAHHNIKIGVLTAFIAYIGRIYTRLDSMSRMLASAQRAAAATHRMFEVLDRVPSVAEPVRPVHPGRVEGKIELRNVSFQYGSRKILKQLNLAIEPGEMIGLVGPSGSGKSTLANLVCRFYDVASGALLVDGVDIRSFPVQEFRRNIGVVLQEPFLFYGTIAENIAYARPDAPRQDIIAAAKAGRAHEFILRLPDGYDSIVGERGQSLSGGERQRISIPRALLTDPRILILDEATSSVDTETEREIQQALDNLIQGRTTLAIAHRLSTLRKADRIVVMEAGEITEVGTHVELLDRSGTYARLNRAQLSGAAMGGDSGDRQEPDELQNLQLLRTE